MWPFLVANLKMMARDRQALFWALVFPFVLVMVFGIFDLGRGATSSIAIIDRANTDSSGNLFIDIQRVDYLLVDAKFDRLSLKKIRLSG